MYPTRRAVVLAALTVPLSLLVVLIDKDYWIVGAVMIIVLLAVACVDIFNTLPRGSISLDVVTPGIMFADEPDSVRLAFRIDRGRPDARVECVVKTSEHFSTPESRAFECAAGAENGFDFPIRPLHRGTGRIDRVWYRWLSPFGLFHLQSAHPVDAAVPIVPNIRAVQRAAIQLASRHASASQATKAGFGEGSEFNALREYVPGLDPRSIDWNQSARHHKLISAEYQIEKNNQIVLAMDTGRLMAETVDGVSRLDHAINAGLMLGYGCLQRGDRVGLFGFDSKVRHFSRPIGGVRNFRYLQEASASLAVSHHDTNFTVGLMNLLGELSRRTLIFLQTDFVDTVSAEIMVENVSRLALRHLIVFVSISDPALARDVRSFPSAYGDVARAVVAADIANERQIVFERLRRFGVMCMDVPRQMVGAELINRYMQIKRQDLI